MSVNSKRTLRQQSMKNEKIAKFLIDILTVFRSENSTPIALEDGLNLLKENFSVKTPPKIQKSIMEIWQKPGESYSFVIKSKDKKKVLETFTLDSVGTPTCCQMTIGKYAAQNLVFLPVLNSNNISELFIFHPENVTAQEVVITIAKLLESRLSQNGQNETESLRKSYDKINSQGKPSSINQDDSRSLDSISSHFINNWFGKLDSISSLQPNSNSSLASVNEELYVLNQNLKEIRIFMNRLFQTVHSVVRNKKSQKKMNGTVIEHIHLPGKSSFIEIIEKIKICFNLAATHEEIIINPSSNEITNKLFLFLRIIGDISLNESTGMPDLVSSVANPAINSLTVKFFTNNLNNENAKFWPVLGSNFGYINSRGSIPGNPHRTYIDEFQVRKSPQMLDYDERQYLTVPKNQQTNNYYRASPTILVNDYETATKRNQTHNHFRSSPTPLVNDNVIYRSFPEIYEPERKPPLLVDSQSLQYQKPISHSAHSNWRIHSHHSTWSDRQCRFIDAVQLRNGRLGRVIYDRSVHNYRELSVSCNEVVEILKDYGDSYLIKNALGETGDCPRGVIRDIGQSMI